MTNNRYLFVSHVSEDRDAAIAIVHKLEREGLRCWIAPRDVAPGKPFDDEIVDAIDASSALLLIFSDKCNNNEYIHREITVAGKSKKRILPFRIQDSHPQRGLRLLLSNLHWIDGFSAQDRAIEELVRAIKTAVIRESTEQIAQATTVLPGSSSREPLINGPKMAHWRH